jgi:hypothetical protein
MIPGHKENAVAINIPNLGHQSVDGGIHRAIPLQSLPALLIATAKRKSKWKNRADSF